MPAIPRLSWRLIWATVSRSLESKFGPTSPCVPAALSVWQPPQPALTKTFRPAASDGRWRSFEPPSEPQPARASARRASATSAPRARLPIRDHRVQRIRQPPQIPLLPRRRRLAPLPHAFDPDRGDAEFVRGHDVVKVALRHVQVGGGVGLEGPEERLPVAVGRLVRADLAGHYRALEQH